MSEFSDNLRRLRTERGMTVTDLSKKSKVPEIRIWAYEGGYVPSNTVISKLASALDVKFEELAGVPLKKTRVRKAKSESKGKPKKKPTPENTVAISRNRLPITQDELDEIDRSTFGGNLKYIRMSKGVSMSELGRKIGVAVTTISTYENDPNKAPSPDRIVKIANALGVPTNELFSNDGQKEVIDDYELRDYLSDIKDRGEIRALFSLSRDATKDDIDQTLAILKTLRGNRDDSE